MPAVSTASRSACQERPSRVPSPAQVIRALLNARTMHLRCPALRAALLLQRREGLSDADVVRRCAGSPQMPGTVRGYRRAIDRAYHAALADADPVFAALDATAEATHGLGAAGRRIMRAVSKAMAAVDQAAPLRATA